MSRPRPWHRLLIGLVPLLLLGSSRSLAARTEPASDRLTLVLQSDLMGKTSPCGCHIPKGGFARLAHVLDSLRAGGERVLYLDGGGAFPDVDDRPDLAEFMFGTLRELGVSAVGVGPRDLRHGLAWLRDLARRNSLPITCANLADRRTHQLVFPDARIVEAGGVRVGVFSLIGERMDLGPARDSLEVSDPEQAAERTVASLRARGARVIVLLAQLGRVAGEDVATAVPGIDVVLLGHGAPVFPNGRRVAGSLALYAGEQGQNAAVVRLQGLTSPTPSAEAEVLVLGPEVSEHAPMLARVKAFEEAYNERMRAFQRAADARALADPDQDPVDHFVGGAVCARCHDPQANQWRTTAHSLAWETLVREKKDATPECIPCHSVGYRSPGGFVSEAMTPHLVNVQCENCHGMGTQHRTDWNQPSGPGELTCKGCHNAERDPEFDYAAKLPLILHGNTSGESIRIVKARREKGYPGSGH